MPSPSVSLYKLTLPPVIGISSSSHALVMPSIVCENCHMMCGFSGLPKFRQFVAATGVAPEHAAFRAASATACIAESCVFGSYARRGDELPELWQSREAAH